MKKGEVELTESKVARLKPKDVNYCVWDRTCPGFGVRVTTAGSKCFVAKTCITVGGLKRRQWLTLGRWPMKTVEAARLEAANLKDQVRKGEDPKAALLARREALRMDALIDRFYKDQLQVKVSWEGKRLVVERLGGNGVGSGERRGKEQVRLAEKFIRPTLGSMAVRDVGTSEVAGLLFKIKQSTPIQSNRVRTVLSRLFAKAEVWELRPAGSNPVRVQERVIEPKRDRNLSDQEIFILGATMRAAAGGWMIDKKTLKQRQESPYSLAALKLALLAGMRKGEILGLRWEWVNLDEDEIRIPPAFHKSGKKSQKTRVVRLCSAARSVLEKMPRALGNPYVIVGDLPGQPMVSLQCPWERIRESAGLAVHGDPKEEDPGLHDLRRTFSSVAARLKVPELFIGALLGHAAGTVTQGYARVGQDPLQETVEAIGARIAGLLAGEIDPVKEAREAKAKRKTAKAQA